MFQSRWKDGRRSAPVVSRKLIAVALGAVIGIGTMSNVLAAVKLHRMLKNPNAQVEVFVRLSTPSVAELNVQSVRATGELASDAAQAAQGAAVEAEQASIRPAIAALGAKQLASLKVGANGVRVRVAASEIESLRALPGVRSVGRVVKFRPDNITSVPAIGAPQVWAKYKVKGKGVSIGIIDSGIDYTHANFGGPGTVAAYDANNKNIIEPGTFPTAKVVGGYDFAGATYNADEDDSVPTPDPDPLDGNGHGSHVAGTAAGFGVTGSIGPGVAPEAKLYALKVFNDTEGSTNLVSDAIEWALDPNHDGNMRDHLDVINMSLGSPFGEPDDPSAIAAENAADLGIIVVTSAGNEGNFPYITGSPGIAPSVISTAAVTPAGRDWSRVTVTAPANVAGVKPNLEGSSPITVASVAPLSGTLVTAAPIDGCAALTNGAAISGNIALIRRGTCDFIVKVNFATAVGARAVIVYNDGAAPDRIDPLVMAVDTATVPAVMINAPDGAALAAASGTTAASPVQVTLDMAPNPSFDDQIATFSSRGPGHGGSTFKPDLSAPGVSIVSTGVGTGTGSLNLQGTSMASPHTAGAAALLHQLHPRLKPEAIKALLQNSTVNANASADTSLTRQGVGSIRVSKAADLSSYAAPGGVSFGRLNPVSADQETETVTLFNMDSKKSRVFKVKHVPQQTYPGVSVSCPSTVSVPRGGAQDFKIRLSFNPQASANGGAFDNGSVSQSEVDGWCVLSDGTDSLRVGYIAVVDAASNLRIDRIKSGKTQRLVNVGPAPGIAEGFTFAAKGGANHRDDEVKPGHRFDEVGFRTANPANYGDLPVVEFGISLKQKFEHLSDLQFEMDLDTTGDGVPDVVLLGADISVFDPDSDPGVYAVAQIDVASGDGFIDWLVNSWDFNDRVLTLPFTLAAGPFPGFVPTTKFSYTLIVESSDGTTDTQEGKVDFAKELVPDLNSFVLDRGVPAEVTVSGAKAGRLLWLFPNDRLDGQAVSEDIKPTK